ncbi:MAG TPA: dephospho-CoA kinase, partial [Spirochaetia bacterium]|nr:dephospho-CoA kinase [Spirochaetia bacterium]
MNKIVAIVGMCGSGKSMACDVFRQSDWYYIRFGQLTIDKLKQEGKRINPANEREMRESLRSELGMGAFALLLLPQIEKAASEGNVIIDGLYSWSEYKIL